MLAACGSRVDHRVGYVVEEMAPELAAARCLIRDCHKAEQMFTIR